MELISPITYWNGKVLLDLDSLYTRPQNINPLYSSRCFGTIPSQSTTLILCILMASKPFLKWAGGKHKLVPFIEHNLPTPTRKRLIEPFCGSAALSLALDFEHYLLNDINADLIGLFRILKEKNPDSSTTPALSLFPKTIAIQDSMNCGNNSTSAKICTNAQHYLFI